MCIRDRWEQSPEHLTAGGMGLSLYPHSLVKISQLLLNKGVYHGKRLISQDYLESATRQQIVKQDVYKRQELNYKPAPAVKTQAGRKTGFVGVMVPSLEHPFFARIMRCIEYELSRHNYKCIVCNTIDIVNRQVEFMEMLEENVVDGLIACVDPIPGFNGRNGQAIVSMDRYWSADVPLIRSDHEQGAVSYTHLPQP